MRDWYAYAKTASFDSFLVFLSLGVFQALTNRVLYCILVWNWFHVNPPTDVPVLAF